jgi:plasmid stabilization system protein ParE
MSKKYKVIWSSVAAEDLKNIIEYIADENLGNLY